MPVIAPDALKEALIYNETTGVFTWAKKVSVKTVVGAAAGSLTNYGYLTIRLHKKAYLAHRLAWFYVHGKWPLGEIDHINGIRLDNRVANLRDVSGAVNRQNIRSPKCTSTSGVLGVSWCKRRGMWRARVTSNRKEICVGYFDDIDSAKAAYLSAKKELHQGCTL